MAILKHNELGAKAAYAMAFAFVIPAFLVAWATFSSDVIPLPVPPFPWVGLILLTLGIGFVMLGMRELWVHGKGLPMNAFPPEVFVTKGTYALTSHPIYFGFSLACFGVSMAVGSSGGFWLVSPTVALGCTALVLGYERDAIRRHFDDPAHTPYFALPADNQNPTTTPGVIKTKRQHPRARLRRRTTHHA